MGVEEEGGRQRQGRQKMTRQRGRQADEGEGGAGCRRKGMVTGLGRADECYRGKRQLGGQAACQGSPAIKKIRFEKSMVVELALRELAETHWITY